MVHCGNEIEIDSYGNNRRSMKEADLQTRFSKWLRAGGGLVHKISDSAIGFKPFDCFVLGADAGGWLGQRGYVGGGFELKVARQSGKTPRGSIKRSQVMGKYEHQMASLMRGRGEGLLMAYVLGFAEGVVVVRVEDMRTWFCEKGMRSVGYDEALRMGEVIRGNF